MSDCTKLVKKLPIFESWNHKTKPSIWTDSSFKPFHDISSPRSKGAQGERLVEEIMKSLGHIVERPSSSNYDRIISGHKTEIKVSTTWNNIENNFTWQQIRRQVYDRIIFVGINPNSIDLFWATKKDLDKHIFSKDKFRQHAGKKGAQELYWIQGAARLNWFRDIEGF